MYGYIRLFVKILLSISLVLTKIQNTTLIFNLVLIPKLRQCRGSTQILDQITKNYGSISIELVTFAIDNGEPLKFHQSYARDF